MHTKNELLTSRVAKERHAPRFQPNPVHGQVSLHPGNVNTEINGRDIEHAKHLEMSNRRHFSGAGIDPRRGGASKHSSGSQVPTHGGMHTNTKAGHFAFVGGDFKSAVESGSVAPSIGDHLSGYPKPHDMGAVPVHPSMNTSRTNVPVDVMHNLGKAILDQAVGSDRNGLPKTTVFVKPR